MCATTHDRCHGLLASGRSHAYEPACMVISPQNALRVDTCSQAPSSLRWTVLAWWPCSPPTLGGQGRTSGGR